MDAELRQVANGFDNKVRVFEKYDINGYRFRTVDKERKMADRKSTNSGVSAVGDGGIEYYGRVEAIYELLFYGENPPNVVVFKCHWFLPSRTRRTHEHVGLVEIRQDTHLNVPDVYITAQQATQVFYLSYPCQTVENLKGWDVVYDVPPHIRPPPPNEEDYLPHIDPETYEGEFFQETRVIKKRFRNRSTQPQNMEEDNESEPDNDDESEPANDDVEEPEEEEVTAPDDLSMLDRLHKGLPNVGVVEPDEAIIIDDTRDSDDDPSIDRGEETDDPDYC
jgi:hypothetical protein